MFHGNHLPPFTNSTTSFQFETSVIYVSVCQVSLWFSGIIFVCTDDFAHEMWHEIMNIGFNLKQNPGKYSYRVVIPNLIMKFLLRGMILLSLATLSYITWYYSHRRAVDLSNSVHVVSVICEHEFNTDTKLKRQIMQFKTLLHSILLFTTLTLAIH